MTRAVKKAAPSKATRRTATKKVAVPAAPEMVEIRRPSTAYAAGFLTAIQQTTQILHDARSFGDAIGRLQQIEREIAQRAQAEVLADLADAKIDAPVNGFHFVNTDAGPQIRLPAQPPLLPSEVRAQIDQAETAMATAKTPKAKPTARRGRPPRSAK